MKQALELIGKAEGAAEALASSQATVQPASATVTPHRTKTSSSDESHGQVTSSQLAHLLEVSQELQQQQQLMQQEMAELRQLQAEASHHLVTDVPAPAASASDVKTKPREPGAPSTRGEELTRHRRSSGPASQDFHITCSGGSGQQAGSKRV